MDSGFQFMVFILDNTSSQLNMRAVRTPRFVKKKMRKRNRNRITLRNAEKGSNMTRLNATKNGKKK